MTTYIAARALATYLIPGCVGRGVKLGSESSSDGVWKSGNVEIWEFGDLGDLEIQKFAIQKKSAQNVRKVWISSKKNLEGPIWGHMRQFFHDPKK